MLTRHRRAVRRKVISAPIHGTEPMILAYLRDTKARVLCYYAPCSHEATVALCNYADVEVGSYCVGHSRLALREYGKALEARITEDRGSLDVA